MTKPKTHRAVVEHPSGIQVIARAASILRALEGNKTGLTIGEIAKRVELPRPTVQRIVMALQAEQLMCGAGKEKRVGLGPALFKLASSVHVDLTVFVRPIMEKLTERVQESVNLLVLEDKAAVCIAHSASDQELQVIPKLGAKLQLYCTASGKALLAAMPEEEAKRVASASPWKALTEKTLTSWNTLASDLHKVRQSGFAYDLEEHAEGICAISVSVRTNCGTLYAISVPTPAHRFQKKVTTLQRELGKAKQEVEKLIRDHGI